MKLHYALLTKGKQRIVRLLRRNYKLEKPIDSIYYSEVHYVVGKDEQDCLTKIREKLNKSNKYEGFRIVNR